MADKIYHTRENLKVLKELVRPKFFETINKKAERIAEVEMQLKISLVKEKDNYHLIE